MQRRGHSHITKGFTSLTLTFALAAGCTSDDGSNTAEPSDTTLAADGAEEVEGPAPAAHDDELALRVDEAERVGDRLRVALTLGTAEDITLAEGDLTLTTSGGVAVPDAATPDRSIGAGQVAAVELEVPLPDEPVEAIDLSVRGVETRFHVPPDGERFRWSPAPLRQSGFDDVLLRDESNVAVTLYTFGTEAMVSEVTFLAATRLTRSGTTLCKLPHRCRLEDSAGRVYPLLGEGHEFDAYERVRGTLRFLGELPADERQLRLVLAGGGATVISADPTLAHDFTVPSAEESPLVAEATTTLPEPFDIGATVQDPSGGIIELGEMTFHEDRIQLDVRATAGDDELSLNLSNRSALQDPSGYEHPLLDPPEGGLTVAPGDAIEATLVFLTRIAPGTDELQLILVTDRDAPLQAPIQLPSAAGAVAGG